MIDPTLWETIGAFLGLVFLVVATLALIIGTVKRVGGWLQRDDKVNAEIDARVLMIENHYAKHDPTAPDAEYGAANEALERLRKGR